MRSKGIGKALIEKAKTISRYEKNYGGLWLHCDTYNILAQEFYESNGFKLDQILDNYYYNEDIKNACLYKFEFL